LAFAAPHLVEYVLQHEQGNTIQTALDLPMQQTLERVLTKYVQSRRDVGINNASALLIDSTNMEVKALVGSADYHDATIAGQVNGVLGRRSPGSTLKPFIYALALDQGLIHSASILKDAPSNFGVFTPENFDGRFNGPISAQDALIRSRNIPAVSLASKLSKPSLYDFLKLAQVQKLQSEQHYGLALVLGGGEVTMEELVQLYAILPNHGEWRELQYLQNSQNNQQPIRLLSDEATYIVLDMLRKTPRPDTFSEAHPAIAWKTGTSWGFRDAWTAGVFGRYVLVVWVGNFDGASNPALIGIETAAPLFMRMVDALRAQQLDAGAFVTTQPANLQRVTVCAVSGDLPNKECPVTTQAWFIPGKSPAKISTLHRAVLIDSRTGLVVCQPNEFTKLQVFEYWSSDMQSLFKRAGMPLRKPPEDTCNGMINQEQTLNIITPMRGVTHLQRIHREQPLLLRAEGSASSGNLYWFADNALIGQTKPSETMSWLPPHAGKYGLRVVDANGNSDIREITVETVE
jgi:penicillin-binding protein 1C